METQEYSNRSFMIFNVSELSKIDFKQVLEASEKTVKRSVDETKTFVNWFVNMPECVELLETKDGPYTYEEMMEILSAEDWKIPYDKI